LIELYYHKIRVVASEQSLLDEAIAKKAAADRLNFLCAWCIKQRRVREARLLIYFHVGLLNNTEADETMLKGFLEVLAGTHNPVEKAQTHLDLANCLLACANKNEEAIDFHIDQSGRLFTNENHGYGLLDLQDLMLQRRRDSLTREELLKNKLVIAENYFEAQCYQQGIKCLLFSFQTSMGMGSLHNQTQENLQRLELELAKVGGEMLKMGSYIHGVSHALLRAPEYGYALKSLERYVESLPTEISPKYHGLLVQVLAKAYFNLGNAAEAVARAKESLKIFLSGESYIDKSDAAYVAAFITMTCARKAPSMSAVKRSLFEDATETLELWADLDRENDYPDGECEKCLILASEDYSFGFSTDSGAIERGKKWSARAKQCRTSSVVTKLHPSIVQVEIAEYLSKNQYENALDRAMELFEACRNQPNILPFELGQCSLRVSIILSTCATRLLTIHGENSAELQDILGLLEASLGKAWEAFMHYYADGASEIIVACANYIAHLILCIRDRQPSRGDDLLKGFLPLLQRVEQYYDSIRRSSVSTNNFHSLLEKRDIVSNSSHRELYSYAVRACLLLCDPSAAWMWTQKGKARALSAHFGVRALLPEALLKAIRSDTESQQLYEEDRLSSESLLQATPDGYISAARKAETARMQARSNPLLAQVLEIREGAFNIGFEASSLDPALAITKTERQAVKYIDWFVNGENIVLIVRELDGTTHSKNLSITTHEVEDWVEMAFNHVDEAEPRLKSQDGKGFLSKLNKLVDGLAGLTNEDDLLILSPSGPLSKVPLHGLRVEGRILIDRNLVIYSSSAAVFRQCQSRAMSQATMPYSISQKAAFLGVYEVPEFPAERDAIYGSMEKLGKQLHGEAKCGSEVTKRVFQDYSEKSRWLHFHGHAVYVEQDIVKTGLILSNGDRMTDSSSYGSSDEIAEKDIAVPEIFEFDMTHNAPHYSIIACNSGTQDNGPGDEPLGLISALLYAGASSVLGCLWPTPSPAGRSFSDKFYSSLKKQMEDRTDTPDLHVLNLATALRHAVRTMSEETQQPFFWAPFVLHGAWFHIVHKDMPCKD
jgi:CHAT domain-containing protein